MFLDTRNKVSQSPGTTPTRSLPHKKWQESPNTSWMAGVGPSWHPTDATTPRGHDPATTQARLAHSLRPNFGGTRKFLWRSVPQPLPRAQQGGLCLRRQPTLGNAPLSDVLRPGGTRHSPPEFVALLHPPLSNCRPGSCRVPVALLGREAVRQPRPRASSGRIGWFTTPRSKSRTNTLVRTLPPASQQILAAAFSRRNPLRPSVPATAHADL